MIPRRRRIPGGQPNGPSTSSFGSTVLSFLSEEPVEERRTPSPSYPRSPSPYLPPLDMKGRDRTQEFMAAARSMQGMQMNGMTSLRKPVKSVKNLEALQKYSEFMNIAKLISTHIQNTYSKLEKLTLLCKRKSLFDDKPAEIAELTYIIKQDLGSLNKQIARLQELVRGSLTVTQSTAHVQTHSNCVVVSLQSKLASMSNDFKEVLEIRTENLKQERSRCREFSHASLATDLPASARTGFHAGSVLMHDEVESRGGDAVITMPGDQGAMGGGQMMIEEEYLESRASTMQSIESTIVELGSIFQQLAFMVKEQEEAIHRIDHNVEDAHLNVEAAHTEILRYFRSVSSNRWLMIKVFGVLSVFFLVFVVFLL